jgi:hypothetical protein
MSFFDAIGNGVETAFSWVWDQVTHYGLAAVNLIISALPTDAQDKINSLASEFHPYFNAINAWVPLDFICVLVGLYIGWFAYYFVVKLVVRLF